MKRDLLQLLQGNIWQDVLLLKFNISLLHWYTPVVWSCSGTWVLQQSRHMGALQRQGKAAGSQQEERQTQDLALRADLTDTDLFPHGKVIETSAPWGWCWDAFSQGLPVTAGN